MGDCKHWNTKATRTLHCLIEICVECGKHIHLHYGDFMGSIEISEEDGCFHGRILKIDDLVSYGGDTLPQFWDAFVEAVNEYVGVRKQVEDHPR